MTLKKLRDFKKVTINIEEKNIQKLEMLSERLGRSHSEIIRDAIDSYNLDLLVEILADDLRKALDRIEKLEDKVKRLESINDDQKK